MKILRRRASIGAAAYVYVQDLSEVNPGYPRAYAYVSTPDRDQATRFTNGELERLVRSGRFRWLSVEASDE